MRKIVFPSVETADSHGLVAVGGDLRPDMLMAAYAQGIFPWPISPNLELAWFAPDPRGVLFLEDFHLPRSFKKFLRKTHYEIQHDTAFAEIVRLCAQVPRPMQSSAWLTENLINAYCELFEQGHAWCSGTWLNDRLVGGVYGVKLGRFRSAESMFRLSDNAGKCALSAAITLFRTQGISWIDTQMTTEVVASLGGRQIPRKDFMNLLAVAIV